MLGRIAHKREYRHWVIAMCCASTLKSMVRASIRGGVPVSDDQRAAAVHANGERAEWMGITSTATAVIIQTDMNFAVENVPTVSTTALARNFSPIWVTHRPRDRFRQ